MAKAKRRDKNKAARDSRPLAEQPTAPQGLQWWHVLLGAGVALIVIFQVYGPAISGPFLFDDKYLIFMRPGHESSPLSDWLIGVRPTLMFSYWLNYQNAGREPYSYHVLNVVFHALGALLVFFIIRKLLEKMGAESWPREPVALFAGGVFLLHPLQTESVAYVASRSENLSVMLLYAAYAVFLYKRGDAISFPRALAVLALFGAAVTSKEHTAVLPGLLLLTDYYFHPGFSFRGIKTNWRLYVPIGLGTAAGFVFIWRILSQSNTAGFAVEGLPWYLYFFTQCQAIWIYLRMFFLPGGMNIDHDFPMVESLADPMSILGLAGLIGLAGAAWWFRRRYPLISFGVFVFLLLLAPTSSIVPIKDALVERRVYLPSLGLLIIVADLLRRWRTSRRAMAGAMSAVLVVAGVASYRRAQVWSSPVSLWESTVASSPKNWRANFQLAFAYYEDQRCSEAVDQYEKAAVLAEPDYKLLVDWALAYDCASRPSEAADKLRQAASLEGSAHVYTQIAMIEAKQGHNDEALAALAEAEKKNPRFAMTYFYRGNIYTQMGNPARAAEQYRRAIELKGDLDAARRGLRRAEQAMRQQR